MAAFVITAYMGGIPLIYSSQEVGYSKTVNFFTNVLMDWNSNPSYTEEYQKVMAAYHESAPLRGQEPVLYNTGDIASIYYKDGLFVVANTTGSKGQAKAPMERAGDKVTNSEKETIEAAIKELEEALEGSDKDDIEAKTRKLTEVSGELAQKMYADQSDQAQQAGGEEQGSSADDAVDAEFEEVKDEDKR